MDRHTHSSHSHRSATPRRAALLGCVILASSSLAADPKPPKPDPAKPVNYIKWINETFGAGIKENAADVYRQAFEKLTEFEGEWDAVLDGPWSNNKAVSDWLTANQEALSLFRKAASMRECFFRLEDSSSNGKPRAEHMIIGAPIPNFHPFRDVTKGLIAQGYGAWKQGNHKVLPVNAILVLRAAHHIDTGVSMMDRLLGTATATMGYSAIRHLLSLAKDADELARSVLAELGKADPPRAPIQRSYATERLATQDLCQRIFVASTQPATWTIDKSFLEIFSLGSGPMKAEDIKKLASIGFGATLRAIDGHFDAINKWIESPYHLAAKQAGTPDSMAEASSNPFVSRFLSSLERTRVLDERARAARRSTLLICHILVHHGKTGSYPTSLDELKAADLKEIRIDPFSGRDFVYKQQPKGFLLYSMAENLKDDGGKHDESWKDGDYVFWPVQPPPKPYSPK